MRIEKVMDDAIAREIERMDRELLVEARVRVAFISGGRARPIPKPLRIAMKAGQEAGGGVRSPY